LVRGAIVVRLNWLYKEKKWRSVNESETRLGQHQTRGAGVIELRLTGYLKPTESDKGIRDLSREI
jgi:hypothetical protein